MFKDKRTRERAEICKAFLERHAEHRSIIRKNTKIASKKLILAHQFAFSAVISYQDRIQGQKYNPDKSSTNGQMFLIAQFIQGIALTEAAISEGLYANAANLLKQELETLGAIDEYKSGRRRDGKVPRFIGKFSNLRKLYGELNDIAHPTQSHIVEILSTYTDGNKHGPTTVPKFNRVHHKRMRGIQALFRRYYTLRTQRRTGMMWNDSLQITNDLIEALVVPRGYMTLVYQAFFDESGTHAGSPVMSVASYVFQKRQARLFSEAWAKKLKLHGLTYAHMTDCALGFGEYRNMSERQRVQVEKDLIALIRKHSEFGTSITVDLEHFNRRLSVSSHVYTAYTLLLLLTVERVSEVMREKQLSSNITYIFESGHNSSTEAHRFMNAIDRFGGRANENYAGHSFVRKSKFLPLQAADMLAWHVRHDMVRKNEGHNVPRKDYVALVRPCDTGTHVSDDQINWFFGLVDSVGTDGSESPFQLLDRVFAYSTQNPVPS